MHSQTVQLCFNQWNPIYIVSCFVLSAFSGHYYVGKNSFMFFNECSSFVCIDAVCHWKCHDVFPILLLYNWSSVICSFIFRLDLIYCWKTTTLSIILTPFRPSKADLESVNWKPKSNLTRDTEEKGSCSRWQCQKWALLNLLLCCGSYTRCPRQLHYMEQRLQIQLFNFSLTHDKARHVRENRITIKWHLWGLESPGSMRSWNPRTFAKCAATSPLCDVSLERQREKIPRGGERQPSGIFLHKNPIQTHHKPSASPGSAFGGEASNKRALWLELQKGHQTNKLCGQSPLSKGNNLN